MPDQPVQTKERPMRVPGAGAASGFVLPGREGKFLPAPEMPKGFYGIVEYEFVNGVMTLAVVTEKIKP